MDAGLAPPEKPSPPPPTPLCAPPSCEQTSRRAHLPPCSGPRRPPERSRPLPEWCRRRVGSDTLVGRWWSQKSSQEERSLRSDTATKLRRREKSRPESLTPSSCGIFRAGPLCDGRGARSWANKIPGCAKDCNARISGQGETLTSQGSTRVGVYHALAQAMERTGRAETALRLQRVQEKALRETLEQAQAALARAGADLESARARKLAARAEYQEELKRWEAHRACEAEAELILQMMEDEDLRETGRAQAPAAAAPAAAPGARPPPPPPPDTVPEGEPAAPDNYYAALAAAVADAEEEGAGSEAPEEGEPRPPSPAGERGGKRRKLEAALDEELRLV
ncbi:unnamed protein product [Prorocentrum cordatum]|uniref:Uncharacterized protein n=1 Tax=Prorocentrum cordatum TaxID=2364126 RepID=A0ABN9WG82_9DINO|nr:unnamed protein product [Polarella glacialis]